MLAKIMTRATYVATFVREGPYIIVNFPDLGIVTQGNNYAHAIKNAEAAMQIYLRALAKDQDPIPEPAKKIIDVQKAPGIHKEVTVDY